MKYYKYTYYYNCIIGLWLNCYIMHVRYNFQCKVSKSDFARDTGTYISIIEFQPWSYLNNKSSIVFSTY